METVTVKESQCSVESHTLLSLRIFKESKKQVEKFAGDFFPFATYKRAVEM